MRNSYQMKYSEEFKEIDIKIFIVDNSWNSWNAINKKIPSRNKIKWIIWYLLNILCSYLCYISLRVCSFKKVENDFNAVYNINKILNAYQIHILIN